MQVRDSTARQPCEQFYEKLGLGNVVLTFTLQPKVEQEVEKPALGRVFVLGSYSQISHHQPESQSLA